jgi:hypothetical protein
MKTTYLYISLLTTLLLVSCKQNEAIVSNKYYELVGNDYSFKSEMGEYEHYFTRDDGFQGIEWRQSGLYTESGKGILNGYTKDNLYESDRSKHFLFNNTSMYEVQLLPYPEQNIFVKQSIGKEAHFKFIDQHAGEVVYDHTLYMPKPLSVDTSRSGIFKIPYSKIGAFNINSKIYYNADLNNENGLLVILSYRGDRLSSSLEDIQNNHQNFGQIKKFLFVPKDNGVIVFPDGFFDGLPDGAIFTLHVKRSTYLVFDLGSDTHKLNAGSSFSMSLALKR